MKKVLGILLGIIIVFLFTYYRVLDEPIKIGINNEENSQFIRVAKKLGYLDKTDFKIVEYKTRSDNIEAFYTGRLDVVYSSIFDTVFFHGKGEPGKIFLVTSSSSKTRALLLKNDIEILKHMNIAMEADTDEFIELMDYLEKYEIEREEVKIHFFTQREAREHFLSERVDGMYFYKPFSEEVLEKGRILEDSTSVEQLEEVLVANTKALKWHRRKLKKLVKAWYSVLYVKYNEPDKYYRILKDLGYKVEHEYDQDYHLTHDNKKFLEAGEIEKKLEYEISEINPGIDPKALYTEVIIK